MKIQLLTVLFLVHLFATGMKAQEITNAFEDLNRKGTVSESTSEMRKAATVEAVDQLLKEQPESKYYCFTEDRMHDIRLSNAIPQRWADRSKASRTEFAGTCAPGEFYTWQIGVFAPFVSLNDVSVVFSNLVNEKGQSIKSSAINCFNTSGTDTNGKLFVKKIQITKGNVQPLWIGVDVPASCLGTYRGKAIVNAKGMKSTEIKVTLTVAGNSVVNHGDNEGWRKSRLRWLNFSLGNSDQPTAPYTPVEINKQTITYLGGEVQLANSGFPRQITTHYDQSNQLDLSVANRILNGEIKFIIETESGIEHLTPGKLKITGTSHSQISWESIQKNKNFTVTCKGDFVFDGSTSFNVEVKAMKNIIVKDIRLEVPYTSFASKYLMGLGHKGGNRSDESIHWKWNVDKNHQDKIWMGNVNAGLNITFKDQNYQRPLVNIYYALGKLRLPTSWGNENKGGIDITEEVEGIVWLKAYSGERSMTKGETLYYNFNTLITPVKPINLNLHAQERFYHSNSDLSEQYIPAAKAAGANIINIHHKKDIYPFINYPYSDESVTDLKNFIAKAHKDDLKVRLYYTTRELTVKIPELWALRSLGSEVIHDGPGKDARTLIHPNGPNEWLNKNLATHFIPAWYNAFNGGKYKGDMDISVITTPDSRWNNYYLAGLDWMIKNLEMDGVYIDDSALDSKTLQRARRILDADGKRRLVDIHSWNHNNQWAGYANSLHIYLDLLPYVDRTWIGEGFPAQNSSDFWLVEMSGIPFGLLSETLDAKNQFRGMIYGMLPRLPWSGNPVPMWNLWDEFGMKNARMYGYWDSRCPVQTANDNLLSTVYVNGDKALVVIANWTDFPQNGKFKLDEELLGFTPSKASLPEINKLQWGASFNWKGNVEVMGRGGLIILLEK